MLILGTFINMGSDFATSTLTYSGTLISDLSPYLTLMVGVGLTILVVSMLIKNIKH